MGNKSPFPIVTKRLNTKKLARYGVVLSAISMFFWLISGVVIIKLKYPAFPEWLGWWIAITGFVVLICGIILEGKNLIEGIKNYLK